MKFLRYISVAISSVSSRVGARSGDSENPRQDNLVSVSHQLGVGCGKLRTLASVDKRIYLVWKNKKLCGSESIAEFSIWAHFRAHFQVSFQAQFLAYYHVYFRVQNLDISDISDLRFLAVKQIIVTHSHILIFLVLMILFILQLYSKDI